MNHVHPNLVTKLRQLLLLTLPILFLTSCVTYKGYPTIDDSNNATTYDKLYYKISGSTIFSGKKNLAESFNDLAPFKEVERAEKAPGTETFVEIHIQNIAPSGAALVFGYISYSFLTIIPSWSLEDGYEVRYDIYQDGQMQKSLYYQFNRNSLFWLPILPFIWVNLSTPSEYDALAAVTKQFFIDAATYF